MTTYAEAKKKILRNRLIGYPLLIVATISTIVSALKLLYVGLNSDNPVSTAIAEFIRRLVGLIYENTHFLEYFWIYSPQPSAQTPLTTGTILALIGYGMIFVAQTFLGSAKAWSAKLDAVDRSIEQELLQNSSKDVPQQKPKPKPQPKQKRKVKDDAPVEKPSLFEKIHSHYIAPTIVGIIVAIIIKLSGL